MLTGLVKSVGLSSICTLVVCYCMLKFAIQVKHWIVSVRKSAAFCPLPCPDGRHLVNFIHAWHAFSFSGENVFSGRCGDNIADCLTDDSVILACYFDFTLARRSYNSGFCLHNSDGYCNRYVLFWPL